MSLVLAVMMVMVATVAFAAGNTPTSDNDTNAPAITTTAAANVEVTIPKDIVLFNVESSQIYEPNVTYTYKVEAVTVTANTTITGLTAKTDDAADATGTVSVKSGIASGVLLKGNATDASYVYDQNTNLIFGTDNETKKDTNKEGSAVTQDSKKVTQNLNIKIDASTIYANGTNKAGIYRYKITDTTDKNALLAAGIKRDDSYNSVLYLDVYLKNNSTYTGLEVYGYVLYKNTTDGANQSFEYTSESEKTETIKVGGFDTKSETGASGTYNGTTGIISDQYHTYNVEINKTITGSLADKSHQFPFKVEITNEANTITGYTQKISSQADFYYQATQNGNTGEATHASLSADSAWSIGDTATSSVLKLKDTDKIIITGLPANCKVKVSELNDTVDVYTAEMKDEATTPNVLKINTNKDNDKLTASSGTAVMDTPMAIDNTSTKDQVRVTNTLEAISPTGYVTRFAPYALILVAGIALMVVAMKRRKTSDEE